MPRGVFVRRKEYCEQIRKTLTGRKRPKEVGINISKAKKGKKCPNVSLAQKGTKRPWLSKLRKGIGNPMWKGGVTKLTPWIRETLKSKEWKIKIFERDNHLCQECGKKEKEKLEAHHIKPFHKILEDFLNFYNQFSPIDDTETLVRLAESYEPFWDISNGVSLCEDCHKKTDSYGVRKRADLE